MAAGRPLNLDNLQDLFLEEDRPDKKDLRLAIESLQEDYRERGIELREVGSGFRINVQAKYAPWVSRLWDERPARYTRALLETLALIAYRQPITRGEIEEIRGVSVSTNIIKTMMERDWVRVVGQRDVPGRPSLYATTREFLNYFGLKGLNELPTLQEIRDLDSINRELELGIPGAVVEQAEAEAPDGGLDEESSAADQAQANSGDNESTENSATGSADPEPDDPALSSTVSDPVPAGSRDE